MSVNLYAVTLDCSNATELAAFWSTVLGRPVDEGATEEFAAILKHYSIRKVIGDRYGGEFPRDLGRPKEWFWRNEGEQGWKGLIDFRNFHNISVACGTTSAASSASRLPTAFNR